jgi:hypothetical protein
VESKLGIHAPSKGPIAQNPGSLLWERFQQGPLLFWGRAESCQGQTLNVTMVTIILVKWVFETQFLTMQKTIHIIGLKLYTSLPQTQ